MKRRRYIRGPLLACMNQIINDMYMHHCFLAPRPCRHGTTSEPNLNQYYLSRVEPILNKSRTNICSWPKKFWTNPEPILLIRSATVRLWFTSVQHNRSWIKNACRAGLFMQYILNILYPVVGILWIMAWMCNRQWRCSLLVGLRQEPWGKTFCFFFLYPYKG